MRVQQLVRKRVAVVVMAGALGIGLTSCGFANTSSGGPSDPYAAGLFNALNYDRAANGLPRLTWSPKLANQAGSWAHQMANAGTLYHQNLSALIGSPTYAGFRTLGENIFVGSGGMSANQVEGSWMNSAPHRANILSGAFNIVGVGYYRSPDGRIWVVQDFGGI
jgi:uncharacterized protein YkwD